MHILGIIETNLLQSAEAKCNLYTAVEGFRTMALKRCQYWIG